MSAVHVVRFEFENGIHWGVLRQGRITVIPGVFETTGDFIREWADQNLVNVVGGCCGSTPAHIKAMADAVAGKPARLPHAHDHRTRLAGLDPMVMA